MIADRVGRTSNFLKLPHVSPRTASDHAANARELERVVNEIPAGSPPRLYYGDVENLPADGDPLPFTVAGDSNTPVVFAIPAGATRLEGRMTITTTDIITAAFVSLTDTPEGEVLSFFATTPTGIGGDTVFYSFDIIVIHTFPQELQFQASVTTDDGVTTSDLQWAITVTPATTE